MIKYNNKNARFDIPVWVKSKTRSESGFQNGAPNWNRTISNSYHVLPPACVCSVVIVFKLELQFVNEVGEEAQLIRVHYGLTAIVV